MSIRAFTLLLLLAAACGVLGARAILQRDVASSSSEIDAPLAAALADRLADVTKVTVVAKDGTATMVRSGDGWVLEEKGGYPVDPARVRDLVLGVASARIVEAKTDDRSRLARLDLAAPGVGESRAKLVRIEAGADPLLTVVIGKTKYGLYGAGRGGAYVRRFDEAQAWLVDREIQAPATPLSYIDRSVIDLPAATLARIELGEDVVSLARSAPGAPLELADLPAGRAADPEKIDRLAAVVASLQLQDVRKADPAAFAQAPLRARLVTVDGIAAELRILAEGTGEAAQHWATIAVSAAPDPPTAQAAPPGGAPIEERIALLRARLDGWAFKIPGYLAERVGWGMADLLKPEGTS